MTTTDAQVRIIMRERSKGKTQEQAGAKANISSRKTVRKYEQLGKLPSEMKQPRTYRTRKDQLAEDWEAVEKQLKNAPELEAKTLFEWLCEQHPEKYQEGQLRTFQRRVSNWKALNTEQLLSLDQVRDPGKMMQTDGTWMTKLGITIAGENFPHLLIHCVLPYSNWEWGRIAQSESLLAIRTGLQSSLQKLGYVPEIHQTDNSTAATHTPGAKQADSGKTRVFNEEYQQLMTHFGMEPQTIHVGNSNENGDVEAANGVFKKAVKQHLLLRGSRDFPSLESYETFLWQIMEKRNALRNKKLQEEIMVMSPLQAKLWPEMKTYRPKVTRSGIVRIQKNGYSVPSGLKGKIVTVRVYEWRIEVWYANQLVEALPRLVGAHKYKINYRHVVDSVLRKPGGFRNYRHFQALFPHPVFHQAYEKLQHWYAPQKADLAYLRILKLAATTLESDVIWALQELCASSQKWNDRSVEEMIRPSLPDIPQLADITVNLEEYDRLLKQELAHV